ncbi:MAG: ABC transporter ATP-binding protein [Synergistaceae bacterium]|nr:ABC transporter ATP-binding protein [Synergistaceae bacterium]
MIKLDVQQVNVTYDDGRKTFTALSDVSFAVDKGLFVSILGPSGCGKSTILNLFAGLTAPTAGRILLDGKPISGADLDRSVVFQHYSLFPWMSARQNVELAAKQVFPKKSKAEIFDLASQFLEMVGLAEFADKFPNELSGGMQQRVSIARALAMDSEILLMDEPFGAIDTKNRVALQNLLLHLWESGVEQKTVVFVTHDIDEAILLSDKIIVMASGPGRVQAEIPVCFERPRDRIALMREESYVTIRNRIVSLFHADIADKIGGEEVVI